MLETDGSGDVTAVNVFAPDGLVARETAFVHAGKGGSLSGLSAVRLGETQYAFDPEGGVALRLDGNGNAFSWSAYDAYGTESSTTEPSDPFGYHARDGYYADHETGLVYCQNRYYDPQGGRWVTRDPIGAEGGINVYAYCASGPVGWTDPLGLFDLGNWIDQNLLNGGVRKLGTDDANWEMGCGSGWQVAADAADVVGQVGMQVGMMMDGEGEAEVGAIVAKDALEDGATTAENELVDLAESDRRTHILDGDGPGQGGHGPGRGVSGKSEFPSSWSDDQVMHHVSDVATDPSSTVTTQWNGRLKVDGTRDGIDIRVILGSPSENGKIITAFPTNVPKNL